RFPSTIGAPDRERLTRDANDAYATAFQPAWRKIEAFLRDQYLPKARPQVALTSQPNGKQAYDILIHYFTTTRTTAAEVHKLGEQEVARIEAEMQDVAKQAGFTGSVADFERQLATSPGGKFTSQAEMLTYARDVAMRVFPELPRLFRRLPRLP